jgi:hypothetical protein
MAMLVFRGGIMLWWEDPRGKAFGILDVPSFSFNINSMDQQHGFEEYPDLPACVNIKLEDIHVAGLL